MKKLMLMLVLSGMVLSFASCDSNAQQDKQLSNYQSRTQLFQSIMNNQHYMQEFMGMMQNNHKAMQTMAGSSAMMSMMQQNQAFRQAMMQNMLRITDKDSTAGNQMAGMMLNHQSMMQMMIRHMAQHGMMNNSCMQQMMAQMGQMNHSNMMGHNQSMMHGNPGMKERN